MATISPTEPDRPTLRERIADYWHADEFPPETHGDVAVPRWKAALGAFVVMPLAGTVVSLPVGLALLSLAKLLEGHVPDVVLFVAVAAPALYVGMKGAQYVGAPVADHVLGIPREVSD